jgi:cobalamin biosynthesis protein CobW
MHKIPVTIITGFLGAGKTTLIRHLLQNPQGQRIAVLVNEFGEVGIDGDLLKSCQVCDEETEPGKVSVGTMSAVNNIVELANGCLCCTVQEEFLPTMQELMQRRDEIDCIVIETSGLALPKPLVQAFRWPQIRTAATVDSVVTVVDCDALASGRLVGDLDALEAQRQADDSLDHETPIEELFEDQINCADLVLLTKTDLVDAADRARVERWLADQLPRPVRVVECGQGLISPDVLLGFNAAVEDNLDSRPSHHDHEEEHDHDDDIMAIPLMWSQEFEPNILIQRLEALTEQHEIYRIKGFVAVPQKAMRMVVHGVGQRFDWFYDRPWQPDEHRHTKLVIIGKALNAATLRSFLTQDSPSPSPNSSLSPMATA